MDYRSIIESSYNRHNWLELLNDIFHHNVEFRQEPLSVPVEKDMAKDALYLGQITLHDGHTLAVYEVELSDRVVIERNRAAIRNLLVSNWRGGYDGALMFCYRKNESVLRFTYVSESWAFDKQGDYKKLSTDTKRYTYLLGEGRGCRTAVDQFKTLRDSKQTLKDVTDAFSVEALTRQFYQDLFEWYEWAVDDKSNITFPNNTAIEEDDRDDIEKKVIRMITRIMFVWFIKQKKLVPDKIFDTNFLSTILKDFDPNSETDGNFYNAILQNLFFATLNREIKDEKGNVRRFAKSLKRDIKTLYRYAGLFTISEEEVIKLFSEVPFLNGGLFECQDKTRYIDGVEHCYSFDGFSRAVGRFADGRYKHRAIVPNILFFKPEKGLISILNRYNFTIEENSPEEQQVALDPELLGKVFENLLGAYNPETKETARNQSGSFYTPREIVNYMVDESLMAYLGNDETVRSVFSRDFIYDKSKADEYKSIVERLKNVKVLDPACGSGAFPMGLLNKMVEVIERISPEEDIYSLKLSIIEKCLYGSDIQSIAAQITKLRFFISLICDCVKDETKPNFGIPTLPNLETNFVSADSLIAKKKREAQLDLFENPEIEILKEKLREVRHKHFSAKSASTKHRLREKDKEIREKLADLLSDVNNYNREDAKQMAEWDPYDQNAVSSFFDPEWMFGINEKFDIVIGNPPYVQLQNNSGVLAKKYADSNYQCFARTGDIYCLFYERGWQLLKDDGHLCFITSNKWMRAGYGEKIRQFFVDHTDTKLLIYFEEVKVFESATVDTNILLFSKSTSRHQTACAVANKKHKNCIDNLRIFVQQERVMCDFNTADSWVILSPIEQSIKRKIEAVGIPLKDWDINIYRGVLTGCNEAFIINSTKRKEILANCQSAEEKERTEELIRPILRGKDIKRYGYVDNGRYLINTHNGVKGKIPRVDINDYPAVKAHLDQFWDKISKRSDKGDTPYNLRNCAYLDLFFQPHICWKAVGRNLTFSIAPSGTFLTAPASFISAGNRNDYILAYLCSKVGRYFIYQNSDTTGAGDIMLNIQSLVQFPIPPIINMEIIGKCKEIQNHFSHDIQDTLDSLIFDSYRFSKDEIEEIERY
ncbi:Eco57I restriction-modification methylase domain-containing protein [Prevotella denticola]|uniref:Eco57I restriction-modification methylase domain-containing protein n=1 Tax=Prevotella denticola TaxID=28129 RepID=UPI0002012D23|nr:N-6 DNA methylase [Prevotella denticola]AEA21366.1 Eco57I restriction endonuclease [Prevotella denticola F0289]